MCTVSELSDTSIAVGNTNHTKKNEVAELGPDL